MILEIPYIEVDSQQGSQVQDDIYFRNILKTERFLKEPIRYELIKIHFFKVPISQFLVSRTSASYLSASVMTESERFS